ncbi:zinc-dependent metalloprotease [Flaviaesturariibacter amylovorans]|uniref:Peptidase C-terminal archaeal/bacterial domain-containing protein n=1 Tax=Flaviaesturariibacter amylovorans TaxID=1084520 RepID=A0ABP8G8Q4_9BACT
MKRHTTLILLLLLALCGISHAQSASGSSHPAAAAVLFLDFDGHTVNGTQWNTAGPIACGPSNLSAAQQLEIFHRIAEDYRPFNINVTTDSTRYWAAPNKQRMRVIFTGTHGWYGNSVGGVAYIGSWTWGDNTPCFIFTTLLQNKTKWIAEAGAHEAGHTMGLRHQASYSATCSKLTDYHSGTGTGEISWAPIMGVGYYRNQTTWNLGPTNQGCTTSQSDLDVIAKTANGFGFRADDVADHFDAASLATFVGDSFRIDGVIGRTADRDLFRFRMPAAGRFRLDALPFSAAAGNEGADLDILVQLFDAEGRAVGAWNPAPLLNSVVDTALAAGTYFLQVDGKGNQFAPEYGSLGSYALQASTTPFQVLPLHRLQLRARANGAAHLLEWEIVADEVLTAQELEVSTNGRDFRPLAAPATTGRRFEHRPEGAGTQFYRLKVTFNNGRSYTSNTVAVQARATAATRLVSTVAQGGTLRVSCPQGARYAVYDAAGAVLTSGALPPGAAFLQLPLLPAGTYWVRFSGNGGNAVEKFFYPGR